MAWTHHIGPPLTTYNSIELSSSDDHGRTWSRPSIVDRTGFGALTFTSLAVGRSGDVYVAWIALTGASPEILVSRSIDGGISFDTPVEVDVLSAANCGSIGWRVAAERTNCPTPDPVVTATVMGGAERVFVTYSNLVPGGGLHVFGAAFTGDLRPAEAGLAKEIAPAGTSSSADQFLPVSSVDLSTGNLWACYYDTTGHPAGREASFSCTVSVDGGRGWAPIVRVATTPSDETGTLAYHRSAFGGFGTEYGDYEGLAVIRGVAHPVWTDSRELQAFGEEILTTTLPQRDLAGG